MTMSATTVVAVLVVMTAAAILTAFAMMMSATVTATCQHLDGLVDFLLGSIAVLADGAREVERLASQRVVGIYGDSVFLHLHHLGHELMVVAVCQRDDGIGVDVIVVEMTIHREYLTIELMHALRLVGAKGLFWREDKVEGVALRMVDHLLLESVEGDAKTSDKLEGALRACFLLQCLIAVSDGIQLILDGHELIGNFLHTLLYIYDSGCKGNHFNPKMRLFRQKI